MIKNKKIPAMLAAAVLGFFSASVGITAAQLPGEITMYGSGNASLETFIPTQAEYRGADTESADIKLLGLVKVKEVNVNVREKKSVRLCGTLFGVKMYSDGVMVVGLSDFASKNGSINPAKEAGINKGDIIKSVDGKAVRTNKDFSEIIKNSHDTVSIELTDKEGKSRTVALTPEYSISDKCLKTGMWVRDSAAGIGTLTYIDNKNMCFGGLGHGICDSDTQSIVPICGGDIVEAEITDIKQGVKGSAGEIKGYLMSDELGELQANTVCGAFGKYTADLPEGKDYEVALKQEVKSGKAQILCTLESGKQPEFYDIEINKINYSGSEPAKNMIITVTDKRLLEKTGGIVQGMSGSPIVQNGKFVGAVTHVFVNDPTRGYAIFAENMVSRGSEVLSTK